MKTLDPNWQSLGSIMQRIAEQIEPKKPAAREGEKPKPAPPKATQGEAAA